jgi:hypothetical protein
MTTPFGLAPPLLLADRWMIEVVSWHADAYGNHLSAELDLVHLTMSLVYRGMGTGQLEASWNADGYDLLALGNLIILRDRITNWSWTMVIVGVKQDETAERPEQKTCTLSDLLKPFYDRVYLQSGLMPEGVIQVPAGVAEQLTGPTESLVKRIVQTQCVQRHNPAGPYHLACATSQTRGTMQFLNLSGEPLAQLLPKLLAVEDWGDTVRLAEDYSLVYDINTGRDLTVTRNPTNYQLFTVDLDNVQEITYDYHVAGAVNAVLVLGKAASGAGSGSATGTIAVPGSASLPANVSANLNVTTTVAGQARPQLWVEDGQSIAAYGRMEATLDQNDATTFSQLLAAGAFHLAQHKVILQMTFTARETAVERFGDAWTLGDLVTVERDDWGITQDLRITKIDIDVGAPGLRLETAPETVNFLSGSQGSQTSGASIVNGSGVSSGYGGGVIGTFPTSPAGSGVSPAAVSGGASYGFMTDNLGLGPGMNQGAPSAPTFYMDLTLGNPAYVGSSRALSITNLR